MSSEEHSAAENKLSEAIILRTLSLSLSQEDTISPSLDQDRLEERKGSVKRSSLGRVIV